MTDAASRYPTLLSPIALGPVTLRNRAVMSGHGMRLGSSEEGIGDRMRAYLVARAEGGAGLVGIESSVVHPSSANSGSMGLPLLLFSDKMITTLARTADEVHAAGSLLSIILWHGGHNVPSRGGRAALAPSAIPSPNIRETPKAATTEEIADIVAGYGTSAANCAGAGVDVIEVQTSFDYFLGSFLSPTLNRRTDAYGGSLENRVRIVAEVLETVREAVGSNVAVGVRTSVSHGVALDPGDYGLEQSLAAMRLLADRKLVDYVSLITGSYWAMDQTIPPQIYPRAGLAGQSAQFCQELPVPVTVAGRIRTPDEAEKVLAGGAADLVAMARTWIAEPEWMKKIEAGEVDRIRPCMSCNQACIGFVARGYPGTCVLNPAVGNEYLIASREPARAAKTVAVVGGGPAGLEAARLAALDGHRVTLYEAQDQLGGDMRLAGAAPQRGEILDALAWWEGELAHLGVEVKLGAEVGQGDLPKADIVVWAVGARPASTAIWKARPHLAGGIPGTDALPHGRDILAGRQSVSGSVLVIDEEGGWPTISLAETLAAQAGVTTVTIATGGGHPAEPDLAFSLELQEVVSRLRAAGIEIRSHALVASVANGVAALTTGKNLGPFNAIVLATGTAAPDTPAGVIAIGDCVAPRGFWAATNDALEQVGCGI